MQALLEFGFADSNLTASDFAEEGRFARLGHPPVRIDVLTSISGISWEEVQAHRVMGRYGDIDVLFIGREDFIRKLSDEPFFSARRAADTMFEKYQTQRGKLVQATSAAGISGCLVRSTADGAWYFRIYKSIDRSTFEDYRLCHLDLSVTVDDTCAALYSDAEGNRWLDYDPATYGHSPVAERKP